MIILAYIILFIAICVAIYFISKPEATCTDGIQNQAEKGIDCGGSCNPCKNISETKDLLAQETDFANGGNGTFDVVAKISNPNESIGAKEFKYVFTLKDGAGNVVSTRAGSTYILPGDWRYVAEIGLTVEGGAVPASAEIAISDVQWAKLQGMGKPQIGVYSKKFEKSALGSGQEAGGVIRNESGYDLKNVDISVVLRDEKGKIVGINKTQKNSVRFKEDRDFLLIWPYDIGADVQKIEVDPQSDVFDPQNLFSN